jgi:4-hydroxy-2-oxoheptanedioate aldolase
MNKSSSLRTRILAGERVFGTFFKLNCMDAAEIIGNAGFDFIIIDTEHGNYSPVDVTNIIRAADSVNMSSIVRVRSAADEDVLHALDSGADGVQIPSITSVEQAKTACASAKYFPEGTRGLSTTQRSARFGAWNLEQPYTEYANERSLVVVHVENVEMASRIDELCDIPQIDVIFIGPGDLSQSLGVPGKLDDPRLLELIETLIEKTLKKGKAVGIFCGNTAAVQKYAGMGVNYILYSADTTLFYQSIAQARQGFERLEL